MSYPEVDMAEQQEAEQRRAERLSELKAEYLQRIQTKDPTTLAQELAEEKLADEDEKEKQMKLARKDPLTEIDNRQSFNERIPAMVDTAIRTNAHLAVLYIDLDDLGQINDTYGHTATDEALRATAATLRLELHRSSDTLFRLGGDEFAAVLPSTPKKDATQVALRLRETMENLEIVINGQRIRVTTSIGVDSLKPPESPRLLRRQQNIIPQTVAALTSGADKAMYAAKAKGGNCIGFVFDSDQEKFEIGELLPIPQRVNLLAPIARNAPQPKPILIHK